MSYYLSDTNFEDLVQELTQKQETMSEMEASAEKYEADIEQLKYDPSPRFLFSLYRQHDDDCYSICRRFIL